MTIRTLLVTFAITALAILGVLTYPAVHAPTVPDVPRASDCATYGPGNLLDHWSAGVVIDTCAPDTIGYRATVALLAQNASR